MRRNAIAVAEVCRDTTTGLSGSVRLQRVFVFALLGFFAAAAIEVAASGDAVRDGCGGKRYADQKPVRDARDLCDGEKWPDEIPAPTAGIRFPTSVTSPVFGPGRGAAVSLSDRGGPGYRFEPGAGTIFGQCLPSSMTLQAALVRLQI